MAIREWLLVAGSGRRGNCLLFEQCEMPLLAPLSSQSHMAELMRLRLGRTPGEVRDTRTGEAD